MSLLKFLQFTTPLYSEKLIALLSPTVVSLLIDSAVEHNSSLGPLKYGFRALVQRPVDDGESQREKLEITISPAELWRLINSTGDLSDLANIFGDVSEGYFQQLVAPGNAPTVDNWCTLIQHGNFYCVNHFAADHLPRLPSQTSADFLEAVRRAAPPLIDQASWFELSTASRRIERVSDPTLQEQMNQLLTNHLKFVEPDILSGLNFVEACNAIRLIWDYCPERQPDLVEQFWSILPNIQLWPRNFEFIQSGRMLFSVIRDERFPRETIDQFIGFYWPDLPGDILEKCSPGVVANFLWSLHQCLAFWRPKQVRPTPVTLTENARTTLLARLSKYASAKDNQAKLGVLKLAGMMAYLWPVLHPEIAKALRGSVKGVKTLLELSLDQTFVPAAFASMGLTFIAPYTLALSHERVDQILLKIDEYSADPTPQVLALAHDFRNMAR